MKKYQMMALAGAGLVLSSCQAMFGVAGSAAMEAMSTYVSAVNTTLEINPLAEELLDASSEFCPERLYSGTLMCTTTRGDSVSYWSKGHCVGFEYENEEDSDVVGTYAYHPKGCAQMTIEGENENGDPYTLTYELFFSSPTGGTVFETYTCDSDTEKSKGTFILR